MCTVGIHHIPYDEPYGHIYILYYSGALINFIKWVLKYYLEVILYNCV